MAYVDSADLAGTGAGQGAAMVGFVQSGAGAVARTLRDKVRETITPQDFGATSSTDSSAAFANAWQAAVNANLPLTIDGTIRIDGTFSNETGSDFPALPGNIQIEGTGTLDLSQGGSLTIGSGVTALPDLAANVTPFA